MEKYMPPEVVDQDALRAWRDSIKKHEADHCPEEVKSFITALAKKLPDFGQIGKFTTVISGYELLLSGMKHFNGEKIYPWEVYRLPVPHMVAVDHETAMHRIFHRRGKQGLIDYCKARVKGTELERLMDILYVHVFKQEHEEFKKVLAEINQAKQLDTPVEI